jgi:hypothetical protein
MHASMDGSDMRESRGSPRVVGEGQRQHGAHCVMKPRGRLDDAAFECAVLQNARGHQRMGELHENCARPPEQHDAFAVDAVDDHRPIVAEFDVPPNGLPLPGQSDYKMLARDAWRTDATIFNPACHCRELQRVDGGTTGRRRLAAVAGVAQGRRSGIVFGAEVLA